MVDGDNNVTLIEREPGGNPVAIIAPGGQRTVFTLDPNGYLATISDPAGDTAEFGYTDNGLLTSLLDARQNNYSFTYDPDGRLTRDEDPEGGFTFLDRTDTLNGYVVAMGKASGRSTTFDVQRLPTGTTQRINTWPNGSTTSQFTGANKVSTTILPDGTVSETTEGPDPRWGMAAPIQSKFVMTTPGGLVDNVTFSRMAILSDPANIFSLTSQTDNTVINGNTWSQVYSASTKRFTLTSPVGRQTFTGIDNQGRVVLFNSAPTVDNITFAYDSTGKMHQTAQAGKSWTYGYDSLNRITSVTDPLDNVVQYRYDNADRVSQVILPSGRTYGFLHDNNGNLTSITMPSGAVHGLGYNESQLGQLLHANNFWVTG